MLHEPAKISEKDNSAPYKATLGMYMFILYGLIYAGFIAINVINAKLMEVKLILGLNMAVVYGMGLIIMALILAIFYNHLCTTKEKQLNQYDPNCTPDKKESK